MDTSDGWASEEPLTKKVFYKQKFHGEDSVTFSGLPIWADDGNTSANQDYDLLYFCNLQKQKQWLSVLCGFTVDEDEEPPAI